jgi:ATP-dependent RNA helicase RhlE
MFTDSSASFSSLALSEPLQRALTDKGYTAPSPIQARAIPHLLEGRDLIGLAQTGTGKTAAFALPLLDRLHRRPAPRSSRRPRALVLTPTRELAVQIGENIARYGTHLDIRHALVFGGVGEQPQIRALANGTDVLVATPGRLLDLMHRGHAVLDRVEVFVLDEADRMLDMGFAPDVRRVVAKLPQRRQSLLFSATMPESIRSLAAGLLTNPVTVEVAPVGTTAERITQRLCLVPRAKKHSLLAHFLRQHADSRVLVFARTKHGADKIAKLLIRDGFEADALHGNKSQGARQRALKAFADGTVPILVATDIAARGIDVKEIGLVVNYELPEDAESYVHRIGRTARAGASGLAIAFCDPSEERDRLRDVQRLIRGNIPVDDSHPFASAAPAQAGERPASGGGRPQHHGRAESGRGRPGRRPQAHSASHAAGPRSHETRHAPESAAAGNGAVAAVRRFFGLRGR